VSRRWVLAHALAAAGAAVAMPALAQTERPLDPHERQRLADLANAFLKAYDMPGLSVAIMRHGQIAYADSFGLADKSTGERVTNDHLFRIASVSKPITSVGIFTLIEQGKLGLDDKVFGTGGILGAGFAAPAGSSVSDITVGQLLRHTGGGWSNNPDPMDDHKSMSQRELIAWTLRNKPLAARPGTRFAYSNFGYCVLGRVIERASGQSYGDYIQKAVLARCGISTMRLAANGRAGRAAHEVTYHHRSWDPYAKDMARIDSTGGWLARATDLAQFAAHVSDFPDPPGFLNHGTIRTMTTPSAANPHYAHGWSVLRGNWRHDGRLPGSTATLVRTQRGYCWAGLTNSSNPDGNRGLDDLLWKMVQSIERWSPGKPPTRN
jgi:CubicO group peptidase (beta-lactamase class C family)